MINVLKWWSASKDTETSCKNITPDRDRDVFLVTYPRSGTTWVSCMAVELLFDISPASFDALDALVLLDGSSSQVPTPANSKSYIVKSHSVLNIGSLASGYKNVIYVIRDPRDVLISYYRYAKVQYEYVGTLENFANDWVSGRIYPCSWAEHVNSWLGPLGTKHDIQITLIRYEDLLANTLHWTKKIAEVLKVEASDERLKQIIEDSSPEKMRRREVNGDANARAGLQFIGSAKSNAWKDDLEANAKAINIVEEKYKQTMLKFGY